MTGRGNLRLTIAFIPFPLPPHQTPVPRHPGVFRGEGKMPPTPRIHGGPLGSLTSPDYGRELTVGSCLRASGGLIGHGFSLPLPNHPSPKGGAAGVGAPSGALTRGPASGQGGITNFTNSITGRALNPAPPLQLPLLSPIPLAFVLLSLPSLPDLSPPPRFCFAHLPSQTAQGNMQSQRDTECSPSHTSR